MKGLYFLLFGKTAVVTSQRRGAKVLKIWQKKEVHRDACQGVESNCIRLP